MDAHDIASTSRTYLSYLESVRNLSPATITAYETDLESFVSLVGGERDVQTIELADVRRYIRSLSEAGMAVSSVNRRLSAIKGFFRFLVRTGMITTNPADGVRSLKSPRPLPEVLFEREMGAVIEFPIRSFGDLRDRVLLELLYSSGARVSEICGANVEHLALARKSLLVRGKGSKDRYVFLGSSAEEALRAYLPRRSELLRERGVDSERALVVNVRGGRLSTRGAFAIVERRTLTAGINRQVGPHAFRHSFATHVLNNGADIRVVQELLGHSQLSTTQVYAHVGLDRLKSVYANAHPHAEKKENNR